MQRDAAENTSPVNRVGVPGLWQTLNLPRLQTFDAFSASKDFRLLWIANFCAQNAQWLQLRNGFKDDAWHANLLECQRDS